MPRFGAPRTLACTAEEWAAHLAEDERLRLSLEEFELQMAEMTVRLAQHERELAQHKQQLKAARGRAPPPPEWAHANVPERSEEERKKRGAAERHESHHRPTPARIDAIEDARLESCPRCGMALGGPFAIEECVVEMIAPGHVRVTKHRIGRYRCGHCRKVRRARLAPDVAPPRSRSDWGSHFLVGYWSLQGLTASECQDLLSTNHGLMVRTGTIDAMLRHSTELFAPGYVAIREPVRHGKSVHVDWRGWRVDGINHHLWDFLSPEAKGA